MIDIVFFLFVLIGVLLNWVVEEFEDFNVWI